MKRAITIMMCCFLALSISYAIPVSAKETIAYKGSKTASQVNQASVKCVRKIKNLKYYCGDNLKWSLKKGVLTITGKGAMYNFGWDDDTDEIQADVPWEKNKKQIKKVVLPHGITHIGDRAFDECDKLTDITIPNTTKGIGKYAFTCCESLTHITIPDSVTKFGDYAFFKCERLTRATLPQNLTRIAPGTFYYCPKLKSLNIPTTVKEIGESAFDSCFQLTGVTLPQSLQKIEAFAFAWTGLKSVTIPSGVKTIGDSAFRCTYITSVKLPVNLKKIGVETFLSCPNLKSITIPASVTKIGWAAFEGCKNLKHVYYAGAQAQWKKISIDARNKPLKNATKHYHEAGPTAMTLYKGKTKTIKLDVSGTATWTTSDKTVAAVTSKGVVKGMKAGTATITATVKKTKYPYKVTVKNPVLKLDVSVVTMTIGETKYIRVVTVTPQAAVTWRSSNTKIAAITKAGVIKGIRKGKTTITATANGVTKSATITVK